MTATWIASADAVFSRHWMTVALVDAVHRAADCGRLFQVAHSQSAAPRPHAVGVPQGSPQHRGHGLDRRLALPLGGDRCVEYVALCPNRAARGLQGPWGLRWACWIRSPVISPTPISRWRVGWLKYIVNSPEMHLWHHNHPDCGPVNRNFALTLSVWDWLFGTAYLPGHAPERLGFDGIETYPAHLPGQWWEPVAALMRRQAPL